MMGGIVRYAAWLALVLAMALPAAAGRLTVFAAASLKTALDEVAGAYAAQTGDEVTLSYAGSSALARQIALGAPADVFVSANPQWMDWLEAEGRIEAGTRADLLGNRLVLIGPAGAMPVTIGPGMDLARRLGDGWLAMALVDAVPAGIYGKAALQSLGEWQGVADKVAQADNVRAALMLVALGEAAMGVVYATDAAVEDAVGVLGVFPADSHPPIVYPAAAVRGRASPAARAFLDYLRGAEARAIFERHGFAVLVQ
ncbi:MAG: molybdate ABC transporter substrate-binding protein [Roseovarius sp.]|nr:molybdate ABC transporter substrate-binding protein [Roseovarius sp.]